MTVYATHASRQDASYSILVVRQRIYLVGISEACGGEKGMANIRGVLQDMGASIQGRPQSSARAYHFDLHQNMSCPCLLPAFHGTHDYCDCHLIALLRCFYLIAIARSTLFYVIVCFLFHVLPCVRNG